MMYLTYFFFPFSFFCNKELRIGKITHFSHLYPKTLEEIQKLKLISKKKITILTLYGLSHLWIDLNLTYITLGKLNTMVDMTLCVCCLETFR